MKKVASNAGWLFFDKVLRMGVGMIVGVMVARYLGPDRFGLLNYVIAFVGLFSAVSSLGLEGIVIRDIVRCPENADEILGTTFAMRFIGSLILIGFTLALISLLRPGEGVAFIMVALVSVGYILRSFETIDLWFLSQVKSKFTVISQHSAFVLNNIFKIMLIGTGAGVMFFASAVLLESFLAAIGLVLAYQVSGRKIKEWAPRFRRAKVLIREGWPLTFSAIFTMAFLQIDVIMLGHIVGDKAVGLYSAAVQISSACYFLPIIVNWSIHPSIVQARKVSTDQYYEKLQDLFTCMTLLAYAIAIPVSMTSCGIIKILYGYKYEPAGRVLAIHVLSLVFVFLGIARGLWVTNESYMKFELFSKSLAALLNIFLNMILIRKLGIIGAAYATLLSYFVAYVGSSFLFRRARKIFLMQLKSLFLLDVARLYRKLMV